MCVVASLRACGCVFLSYVCVYMKVCICGVLHKSVRVYVVCMFACMCECAVCV